MRRMGVIILTVALSSAIVAGCKAVKRKITATTATTIELSAETFNTPPTINLGRIREGEVVTRKIAIQNIDTQPLVITNIVAGCDCLSFTYDRKPVPPNGITTVELRFETVGLGGEIIRIVELWTTLDSEPLRLQIECLVE